MRENRKIVPGLAGTKKYPAGGILKSRFNPARRLRHLNNQPPKHPCFSISRPPLSPSQVGKLTLCVLGLICVVFC